MPFAATVCAAASLECAAVGEFLSLAAPDVTGSAVAVVALEFSGTIAIGSASGVTDAGADCGGTRAGAAVRFVAGRTENEIVAAPAAAALPISFLGGSRYVGALPIPLPLQSSRAHSGPDGKTTDATFTTA